ncbi:MAG: DNA topoisomerase (ATP-hydrolyzing) subunit B [bacterium]|nr:DNA topoisomerase (ATP-hydrolyzing) subunit B [bacterium]
MTENSYGSNNIQVLKGLEGVRKRPAMYIGGTNLNGLHHLVYEVVDNSVDEAMAGVCDDIYVEILDDNSVRVTDNGRGIPVDMHPTEGKSTLEIVMTVLHAGGKFDDSSYKVSGGLHGVGVSVVNALSEWLKATVYKDGKAYFQEYRRGAAVEEVRVISAGEEVRENGTVIHFKPDPEIFEVEKFHFDVLSSRLREIAYLNKGLGIRIFDEHDLSNHEFKYDGGIIEFVKFMSEGKSPLHDEPFYLETEKDGVMVEVALQYNEAFSQNVFSFANNIPTHEGGTHLSGFRSALTRTLNNAFQSLNKSNGKVTLSGDDVREGLTAVISVKLGEPQFEGQTKGKLGNSEVRSVVESVVNSRFADFLGMNPATTKAILAKCVSTAKTREAMRRARDMARRKSVLESGSLPGKLSDCSDRDNTRTELYLVEGDSAGGSAKMGRDRNFQAILALKGKPLNVEKTSPARVLGNEEIRTIITAIGGGFGEDFNSEKVRYGKIIIMTDADVDGAHIRTLLLTFFYRMMPELVTSGRVCIAQPPLYLVRKGKVALYAFNEEERLQRIEQLGGDASKIYIQRYKGLGEMNPDQLWETTMDPESRMTLQVTIEDAVEADHLITTLMGEQVEPRRKFIEDNAAKVKNLDI